MREELSNAINSEVNFNIKQPNTEIWISDDWCVYTFTKYNWLNVLMARFLLGWKIKKIIK